MIPLIQREVIERRGWIERDRFLELLALAQSAPGPISLNTAIFVGYRMSGFMGAVAAVLGVVVPAFTVILLIALFFRDIRQHPVVEAVFRGVRPAVVALIAAPLIGLAKGMNVAKLAIAAVLALTVWQFGISPVWFIAAGIAGGVLWTVWRKET